MDDDRNQTGQDAPSSPVSSSTPPNNQPNLQPDVNSTEPTIPLDLSSVIKPVADDLINPASPPAPAAPAANFGQMQNAPAAPSFERGEPFLPEGTTSADSYIPFAPMSSETSQPETPPLPVMATTQDQFAQAIPGPIPPGEIPVSMQPTDAPMEPEDGRKLPIKLPLLIVAVVLIGGLIGAGLAFGSQLFGGGQSSPTTGKQITTPAPVVTGPVSTPTPRRTQSGFNVAPLEGETGTQSATPSAGQ